ncbi:hypothetical protein GGR58DRAFT_174148 [Xylaria digitata]|nr:hypothetical protein GGR58DRAFT_174148 [Xylaria digitata]
MFRPAIRPLPAFRPSIPIAKYLGTTPRSAFPQKAEKLSKEQSVIPLSLSRRPIELLSRIQKVSGEKCHTVNRLEDSEVPIVPNRKDVEFQDVRGRGPLFNLSKIELESDYENAKQQWRNLRVEYKLREEVTSALWEENKALKAMCEDFRSQYKTSQERLNLAIQIGEALEAENARLYGEIKHAQDTIAALLRDAMKLDNESGEPGVVSYYNPVGRRRRTRKYIRYGYWARFFGFGLGLLSMASLYSMVSYMGI